MDIKSSEINQAGGGYWVKVTYKATPRAAEAVATIFTTVDRREGMINCTVVDMGRKVRVTRAEQERVNELVGVAIRLTRRTLS